LLHLELALVERQQQERQQQERLVRHRLRFAQELQQPLVLPSLELPSLVRSSSPRHRSKEQLPLLVQLRHSRLERLRSKLDQERLRSKLAQEQLRSKLAQEQLRSRLAQEQLRSKLAQVHSNALQPCVP